MPQPWQRSMALPSTFTAPFEAGLQPVKSKEAYGPLSPVQ